MKALCVGNGPSSDLIPWRDMAPDYELVIGCNWRIQHPEALTHWVVVKYVKTLVPFFPHALSRGVKLYGQRSFWEGWGYDPPLTLYRHLRTGLDPWPERGECTRLYQWGVMQAVMHLAYNLGADELHVTGMDNGFGYSKEIDRSYTEERLAGHQYIRDEEPAHWQRFIFGLRGFGVKLKALTPTPIEPLFWA